MILQEELNLLFNGKPVFKNITMLGSIGYSKCTVCNDSLKVPKWIMKQKTQGFMCPCCGHIMIYEQGLGLRNMCRKELDNPANAELWKGMQEDQQKLVARLFG